MEAKEDVDTANKELEIAQQEEQAAVDEFNKLVTNGEPSDEENTYYLSHGCYISSVSGPVTYSCPPGVQSYASTVN